MAEREFEQRKINRIETEAEVERFNRVFDAIIAQAFSDSRFVSEQFGLRLTDDDDDEDDDEDSIIRSNN